MKLPIYNLEKKKAGEASLPSQFDEENRPDLVLRAVLALQSSARQAYGASPEAGLRHSTKLSKRRRDYRGCYGFGISRVNRKILSRRGTRMNWVGAFSPQTVGGHRSHPPKALKQFEQKINKKENCKAIRAAMGATLDKNLVLARGHHIPSDYPFVVDSSLENLAKTKDVETALTALGLTEELTRSAIVKVRSGRGKLRGRRYRHKKGPLIVVSAECALSKAAHNIPGIEVVQVKALNAEVLAPGALPGRVTLWTTKSLDMIKQENLFA